jgi:hypothetical protein
MPTHAAAQLAIETRFRDNWIDQNVALRFENEARKKPADEFIRLVIRNFRAAEVGFAAGKILYRRPGVIYAQCFVQGRKGTQRGRVLADAVLDIFEGQSFSSITCNTAEVEELGDDKEGFWQVNAKVFFDHDFERTY